MRCGAFVAILALAIIAGARPSAATFNWDYQCTGGDKQLRLDLSATFTAGTAGPIQLTDVSTSLESGKNGDADPDFAREDVEQFWAEEGEAFLIAFSRYVEDEPEPARLKVVTTCKQRTCTGHYQYKRRSETFAGTVNCTQSEAG